MAISKAFRTAAGVSTITQMRVRSGAPPASSARSMACTSSAEPTFGTSSASGPAAAMAATSASYHEVSAPLARIATSRGP